MIRGQLAHSIKSATAYYNDGRLVIGATVIVTASNYRAELFRSPILIFPPSNEFLAYQTLTTDIGEDVLVPRNVTATFVEASKPNVINIRARENNVMVEVKEILGVLPASNAELPTIDGSGGEIPSPHLFEDRATGYSSISFEDAFNDAVKKLTAHSGGTPDVLKTVTVIESGGQYGGFAGFNRFFVTVSSLSL